MTDTSMERLMSLAALTASVATPAPSPVRGEPDIDTFMRALTPYTLAVFMRDDNNIVWPLREEVLQIVRSLLSDRERMTRRIAELEAAVDQLRAMRSPHILGGPGYETGDEAFWRRQQESRASLPSDPDHER